MHETRTLAQFVAQIQFADLPSSLIDECKIAVLDTFAAGFVGPYSRGRSELSSSCEPSGAPRGIGDAPGVADGYIPCGAGQWRPDRGLRVRATHGLTRLRHGVPGRAGSL